MTDAKFPIGRLVVTRAAENEAQNTFGEPWREKLGALLSRHARGDWGDLNAAGLRHNDAALLTNGRLFSAYEITRGVEFWIITEADRKVTHILLPTGY